MAEPWLSPAVPPHSSPAKEVASLVNGVQPGKHENGFSGTGGAPELLELSHHGTSPGSIIPFGDKEPFLKQAVVKPPQVTGERWGVRGRGAGSAAATLVSLLPPPPLQRCCEGQTRLTSPRCHRTRPDSGRPRRTVAVVTRKTSLLPPARPCCGGSGGVGLWRGGNLVSLRSFYFVFLNMHLIRLTPPP